MNKKIILSIAFAIILASAVFVLADYDEADEYRTSITLEKGWNLVSIYAVPDALEGNLAEWNKKRLDERDLGGIFIYDKYNNKYIQTYPNYDTEKMNLFAANLQNDPLQKEFWAWTASSMWVYSNKKQTIEYSTTDGPAPIDLINLKFGWNFLSITPQMNGKTLNDIKGNCNIQKSYGWWVERQTWDLIDLNDAPFSNTMLGRGIILKVSSNCKLGSSSITPPPFPDTITNPLPETNPETGDMKFPETIGEYTLKSQNPNNDVECAQLEGNNVCVQMGRVEYVNLDNRAVHVLPTKIISGKDSYINYIKTHASEKNVDGITEVYRGAEPWELYWFTNNDYDMIGTQDYKYIPQTNGVTSQTINGTTTTSVAKWLLNKFPPIKS